MQATEVIKQITGIGEALIGRLLSYDALKMDFNEIKFIKDPDCKCCGEKPSITGLVNYDAFCCSKPASIVREINVETLKDSIENDKSPVLIDVRDSEELKEGFITNSIHIPMEEVAKRLHEIPKDKPVVVYCYSGMRSTRVIQELEQKGYANLVNLKGGYEDWETII